MQDLIESQSKNLWDTLYIIPYHIVSGEHTAVYVSSQKNVMDTSNTHDTPIQCNICDILINLFFDIISYHIVSGKHTTVYLNSYKSFKYFLNTIMDTPDSHLMHQYSADWFII